ncbi:hypothetical protein ACMYL3_24745, partial [Salmonella enterica subsp. enterica serovar Typhimurium]|uniref:hypothetical protein n=1 Tax=Salmonella enterica TaxID=28901 RepID=UPI0039E782B7
GVRIVAVSDTALSTDALAELINHFHGPGLIDRIYSSADVQASKRFGGLFTAVLEAEAVPPSNVLHMKRLDPHHVRHPKVRCLIIAYM